MELTKEERQEMRERCAGATSGPLEVRLDRTCGLYFVCPEAWPSANLDILVVCWCNAENKSDAVFIAHARADMPKLLNAVDQLEEKNRELTDRVCAEIERREFAEEQSKDMAAICARLKKDNRYLRRKLDLSG